MKRIWIDGFEANVSQRVGSGQIGVELLKHLEKIDKENEYTILLASAPLDDLPKERLGWSYKILKIKRFKTWLAIPWVLYTAKQRPDVMFSPTHYIPRFSPVKRVVTIFDLAYLNFPKMFLKKDLMKLKSWTKYSIEHAYKIITISKSSKDDIQKNYKIPEGRISISYPGYDLSLFKPANKDQIRKAMDKYKITGSYIIYIGTIQPRKNLVKLIESFKNINNAKLVIVGKTTGAGRQGWMFEETLAKPKELGIEDKVIFTGFAPSEDLAGLLSGASGFILPSLYEGFGIPLIEAMACGTPVLASNVSSLPEVVGDAGILFDPESTEEMSKAMRSVLEDQDLRIKMIKKGFEQAKKFSWEKMAKEVIHVLENV